MEDVGVRSEWLIRTRRADFLRQKRQQHNGGTIAFGPDNYHISAPAAATPTTLAPAT
jgi:hypothetical protein